MALDTRNLRDIYKDHSLEWIINDLNHKRHPYILATVNDKGPNCGVLVRNANAFLASAIYLCGSKNWDRRTAVGANHYENIRFSPDMESVIERHLGAYRIVAIENNIEGAKSLPNYQWHKNSLILFGNETTGLGENILSYADDIITIPQWGSVRSLNVGSTSAIVCYDYCEKMRAEAPQGALTRSSSAEKGDIASIVEHASNGAA